MQNLLEGTWPAGEVQERFAEFRTWDHGFRSVAKFNPALQKRGYGRYYTARNHNPPSSHSQKGTLVFWDVGIMLDATASEVRRSPWPLRCIISQQNPGVLL